MQGFIEPKLHPSVYAIVVFYYNYMVYWDFFAIKSDKNHQLQSKSHRNNNNKNSICKRIIIWCKFLLCCGNTALHMFQSEWHYDK